MNIDTVIIGGGISGLYYAYKYLKDTQFRILEATSYIGGRIKVGKFCGQSVVYGAGIGRYDKDVLLKKLLDELNIPYTKIESNRNQLLKGGNIENFIKKVLSTLLRFQKENPTYSSSFKDIVIQLFDLDTFNKFVEINGYSDFIYEDYRETIFHYGIEDNMNSINIFNVPWDDLVKKLITKINRKNILTNCKVDKICKDRSDKFIVYINNHTKIIANKIIIATNIDTTRTLLPNNILYDYISGQSFSRIYVKFDKKSTRIIKKIIKGYTIVNRPLQKIIPISESKGIYMIAYNDNESADFTKDITKKDLNILVNNILQVDVIIEKFKIIYWPIGTHYFKPYFWEFEDWPVYINQLQNPGENVHVIGEAFSFNQGWVEGALESVENIYY